MLRAASILSVTLAFLAFSHTATAQTRILFLSKSAGFEHSTIKEEDGKPSHTGTILEELAARNGATLTTSKNASLLNAENLKNYDAVMMYTTANLMNPSMDGGDAIGENGVEELLDWVKAGGALVAYHSTTDTFHRNDNKHSPESPFLDALGGEFLTHGAQFEGKLSVVDQDHPAMANVEDGWTILDEWYCFEHLMEEDIHVLALLQPGAEREKQDKYNIPDYPIIWCRSFGAGRIFYNAMGHREDVWSNEAFQRSVVDAVTWALGEGPAMAEPNYATTVPASIQETAASREDESLSRPEARKIKRAEAKDATKLAQKDAAEKRAGTRSKRGGSGTK